VTCQIFLSEKAQRDLDTFSDKIANQILADCTRLTDNAIPDGKRIKKLHGYEGKRPGAFLARGTRTIRMCSFDARSRRQPWPLP